MKRRDLHQDELPLASIAPHALFPGRTTLYVHEVAKALSCTIQHVLNLIEEFEHTGGTAGLKGFSIGRQTADLLKTQRATWRIAVSDFDRFVAKRATSHTQP